MPVDHAAAPEISKITDRVKLAGIVGLPGTVLTGRDTPILDVKWIDALCTIDGPLIDLSGDPASRPVLTEGGLCILPAMTSPLVNPTRQTSKRR
ncbi:hypothetical protein [Streptomyces sp. NPDC101234]|uniref:hypothetical protein n=1 Tax=Streptomyces sp. NPDC101234 TaxID=3366138 RepID=UPI0037FFBA54